MLHTINISVWGVPATISISDDVLRWIYIADSLDMHRHRIALLMRYIIKNKKFKINDNKRIQQEKRLLYAFHKANEKILKECMAQEVVDFHHAGDVIKKCESVNSKYYIHKYKG